MNSLLYRFSLIALVILLIPITAQALQKAQDTRPRPRLIRYENKDIPGKSVDPVPVVSERCIANLLENIRKLPAAKDISEDIVRRCIRDVFNEIDTFGAPRDDWKKLNASGEPEDLFVQGQKKSALRDIRQNLTNDFMTLELPVANRIGLMIYDAVINEPLLMGPAETFMLYYPSINPKPTVKQPDLTWWQQRKLAFFSMSKKKKGLSIATLAACLGYAFYRGVRRYRQYREYNY